MVSSKVLLVSVMLMLIIASSAVSAAEGAIRIRRVSLESNHGTTVFATIESPRLHGDSRISVIVPEAGIYESQKIDLARGRQKTVQIEIPSPEIFDPYVTVVVSSNGRRAVRHVPLLPN